MSKNRCPLCGGQIYLDSSCPSYGNPAMSCFPPSSCGNALEFTCEACDFYFITPRNEFASNYQKCVENQRLWEQANGAVDRILEKYL